MIFSILKRCVLTHNRFKFGAIDIINNAKYTTKSDSVLYQNIDFEAITKGDKNLVKNLKIIILEFDMLKHESGHVPSVMTTDKWSDLLLAKTRSQRMKQINFWFLNEKKKENDKLKKEKKRISRESLPEREDDGHIRYGFGGSTLFLRMYGSTIDRWNNYKLIQAMMFGQNIVLDCSYDQHMNFKEASNCAKQLMMLFADNRNHQNPFNLNFVNAKPESTLMQKLNKFIPTMYDDDFPLNITQESYLDIFPKQKLVYLTPHCKDDLIKYNPDDIYIIGAMVDKENNKPLSLAKAKSEGLRMAKLPLERYLDWEMGTKCLTVNQMLNIMLDLKDTNSWDMAFKHIPRRKLRKEDNTSNVTFLNTKFKDKFDPSKLKTANKRYVY